MLDFIIEITQPLNSTYRAHHPPNFLLGFLKDYKMVIHCMAEDNVAGKILRETRDMCNSEDWAFEVIRVPC